MQVTLNKRSLGSLVHGDCLNLFYDNVQLSLSLSRGDMSLMVGLAETLLRQSIHYMQQMA